jgi:cyclopropane fatty-acyl-phospholipid synthase-like methyltransferase
MMEFLDIKNISEKFLDLINPISTEKVIQIGQALGLEAGTQVIDFGSGFGEILILWAGRFGITGVGIDIRRYACERAAEKIESTQLTDKVTIVCQDAAAYPFKREGYEVAACIGATFIWGGYRGALQVLKEAVRPGGQIVIGEAYWRQSQVPPEFAKRENFPTENEIWQMTRDEGLIVKTVVRASESDWDRYVSADWQGLLNWIENNPYHPDREQVIGHLLQGQEEYFQYGRACLGWGVFILAPAQWE